MRYFTKDNFNKCIEFLKGKSETVETQQELYKFMHEDCHMLPDWNQITVKNMSVYSKVYLTVNNPEFANWCNTLSDGSQVVWNRKYQEFFLLEKVGMNRCDYRNYKAMFPEMRNIDEWLLESWAVFWFRLAQKQLVAIWNGKYGEHFKNYWR